MASDDVSETTKDLRDRGLYDAMCALSAERVPGFEVRFKAEDPGQKMLAIFLKPFVPDYLTRFTTTLYPRVYFPTRSYVEDHPGLAWKTLAHELVHLEDTQRRPIVFPLSYLLPQVFAAVALLAVLAPWFPLTWWALAALFAALPWPSPWRTHWELRGYAMDLAITYWTTGRVSGGAQFVRLFTGWSYYRMMPNEAHVKAQFEECGRWLAETGFPFPDHRAPYEAVEDLLDSSQLPSD